MMIMMMMTMMMMMSLHLLGTRWYQEIYIQHKFGLAQNFVL
jgi:hypothetical protein